MEYLKISLIIFVVSLLSNSLANAYTPRLQLLGESVNGKFFIDTNSVKNIEKNSIKIQAVIYEKFNKPVSIDRDDYYQSTIKYHIFDCKKNTVAVYKGDYYKGLTSNSTWVGAFNYARYINGDSGEIKYSYSNLEYYPIFDLKRDGVSDTNITPVYSEAFKFVCKK
ncbi:hypothetical protein GWP85_07105 [Acinetobacter beijerinckii]|uniref:surface-adhesin E family protein n=1 Tax=Acinetobacter beijerinckii TaxID=262668 RepID=UPI0023DDCB75|nr:surface-adhesin E family protein [Acinetobacter beijerinckii]MDF2417286.1 hypothetical protein [Acinetobacter beijerinckii]